ncbi:hypothetical protein KJ707_02285, partial [Patescibacteria group bacterium]|nr:hypothetical protein [Patescibacteria group bacterium]
MLNRVNKLKSIAGGVFFLLMAVGLVAGYFLTQQSQDIRQQASGGPYEASPNPSLNPSPSPNLSPSPSPPCEDAWCRGAYAASPSPSLTPSPTPQTSLTPLASPSPSPPCEDAWCRVGGLLPTPSPSLRPTPTPNTITQSDCDRCLATNTPSECRSACSNIGETYNATPTCTPGCLTSNTLRTCSNTGIPGSIT